MAKELELPVTHTEIRDNIDSEKNQNALQVVATREEDIGEQRISGRTALAIFALAVSYEAALFSFILPANILLTINADVGPAPDYAWIAVGWTLASAVLQTMTGRLSDIFGRRYLVLAGDLSSLIGCIVASTASSINQVIAGSILLGVGVSGQSLCYACMNELVPKKHRGVVLGAFNSTAIPSSIFGSVIAYAMVAHLTWRWTYYIGIILNGLGLILIAFAYYPPQFEAIHPDGKTKMQQVRELDYVGLLLFGAGLTLFLLGLSWGGTTYVWRNIHVAIPLALGAFMLFICFPLWEWKFCPAHIDRLVPRSIIHGRVRVVLMPMVTIFVSSMLYYSMAILWPTQIQLLFTTVPLTIGWYSCALGASSTLGAVIGSISFSKLKHTRVQFTAAIVVQSAFIAALASITKDTPVRGIVFVSFAGFAIGYTQNFGILIVQLGAPDSKIGTVTGLLGTIRSIGGAVGTTIYSSVLTNYVKQHYATKVGAAAVQAGLPAGSLVQLFQALSLGTPAALDKVPGINVEILTASGNAVKGVYTSGFRTDYLISIAFGVIAICAAASIRSVDNLMTNKVAATLDKPHLLGKGDGTATVLRTTEEVEELHREGEL